MDQPSAANVDCDENGIQYFRWPPFPDPAPGVDITPFNEFKPSGIQMSAEPEDDGPELDGLGVPTVKLSVTHDPNHPKKKRKTRHRHAEEGFGGSVWWEKWELEENLHTFSYNSMENQVDRLMQAVQDFETNYEWPPAGFRVREWFNKFIVHIGLNTLNLKPKTERKAHDEDDEETGDEVDDEATESKGEQIRIGQTTEREHRVEAGPPQTPVQRESLENFMKKLDRLNEAKERRLDQFLSDPELSLKIFFSSHFCDSGMMWEPPALRDAPRVVLFFLRFLLRNKVLIELEKDLQAAINIGEKARVELWGTKQISMHIPDKLAKCLIEIYGSRVKTVVWPDPEIDDPNEGASQAKMTEPEDGKKLEMLISKDEHEKQDPSKDASKAAVGDRTDAAVDAAAVDPAENDQDWSSIGVDGDWAAGNDNEALSGWGEESNVGNNPWATQNISNDWYEPEHRLEDLVGPTTIPTTYTVGYVESSTRFVSGWKMPNDTDAKSSQGYGVNSSKDLYQLFARAELSPYSTYSDSYYAAVQKPEIHEDPFKSVAEDAGSQGANPHIPHHDPEKDMIILLMDPVVAGHLVKGIGIGGTFVQVVPDLEAETSSISGGGREEDRGQRSAQKEAKSKRTDEIFWYAEKVLQVLPSFWTEKPQNNN